MAFVRTSARALTWVVVIGTVVLLGGVVSEAIGARGAQDAPRQADPETPSAGARAAAPAPTPTYKVLENRLTMREPFNASEGKVRVIAFLSPTCPRCLKNAGQIQRQLLDEDDSEDIQLFVVWVKALDTDSEKELPKAMRFLPDPRVQHFWDEKRALNAQLLDAVAFDIRLRLYDVFLVYDRAARWEKRLPRPGYFMHELKHMPGPAWDIQLFIDEIQRGLDGEPLSDVFN